MSPGVPSWPGRLRYRSAPAPPLPPTGPSQPQTPVSGTGRLSGPTSQGLDLSLRAGRCIFYHRGALRFAARPREARGGSLHQPIPCRSPGASRSQSFRLPVAFTGRPGQRNRHRPAPPLRVPPARYACRSGSHTAQSSRSSRSGSATGGRSRCRCRCMCAGGRRCDRGLLVCRLPRVPVPAHSPAQSASRSGQPSRRRRHRRTAGVWCALHAAGRRLNRCLLVPRVGQPIEPFRQRYRRSCRLPSRQPLGLPLRSLRQRWPADWGGGGGGGA